ncbi:MAG: hypothetical protein BLM47_01990 [Candidatus Reconcilbacillus cellulovorans]|uniref:Uncharacterized protein n=1 Tax=Candidatus Reconcilbacillus cellulovorans TaxID=1906605 RepID=A0A2A6E2I5_9BACL|nr:MAG: hypothetical protein BLM47_01990 [Candidatus Reconcilbacillus cellulovorans]
MTKYNYSPEHPYFAGTLFVEKKEKDKFFKSVFFVCGERDEVEKFEQEQKQNFRVRTYGYLFRTWEEAFEGLKKELIEWVKFSHSVDELVDSLENLKEKIKIFPKAS